MDGSVLLRKGRLVRQGGEVALCVREQVECVDFQFRGNDEQEESLWVRVKGWANIGDSAVA